MEHSLCKSSPKHHDILQQGEEDEDDAGAHPDVEGGDVAHPGGVLPDGPEHGGEGEEGGHGHGHPPGDGLGREEEGEPSHDHEQARGKVRLRIKGACCERVQRCFLRCGFGWVGV